MMIVNHKLYHKLRPMIKTILRTWNSLKQERRNEEKKELKKQGWKRDRKKDGRGHSNVSILKEQWGVRTHAGELKSTPGLEGNFPNSFMKLAKRSRVGFWCYKSAWLLVSLLVTKMITEKFQLLKCTVSCMEDQGAGFSKGNLWISDLSKFSFLTTEKTGWTVGVISEGAVLWGRKKEKEIGSSVFLERLLYRKTLTWVKGLASLFLTCAKENKGLKNDYALFNSEAATVNIINLLTYIHIYVCMHYKSRFFSI